MVAYSPDPDADTLDVLVVDDEPTVASTTVEILRRSGLSVTSTTDLVDAALLLVDHRVRLLILDHQFGEFDASTFLEEEPDVPPVIIVSALGPDVLAKFQEDHPQVVAYRSKPLAPAELVAVVTAALAET